MSATAGSVTASLPMRKRVVFTKSDGRTRSGFVDISARIRAVPSARSDLVAHDTPGPLALGMMTFRHSGLNMNFASKKLR
jgi:hypothetical protein